MVKVKKKQTGRGSSLDKISMREFRIFAMNDYPTYRHLEAFADNYAKKKVKGTYNKTKAIQGLANNAVPRLLKKYGKDYGNIGTISSSGKKKLGQALLSEISELIDWKVKEIKAKKKRKR